MSHATRILHVDLETAPNLGYFWGLWQQNISHEHVETNSYVLCWSAKWDGRRGITYASVQHNTPKVMLQKIHTLLDQADIVVHYNGSSFDIPILNKEFLKQGLKPPAPYRQIDLLRICRSSFRFDSNKLDAVTKYLGMQTKMKHRGFQLWVGCMRGDKKCWKEMERYNRRDVVILERLYHRLLPWIAQHPLLRLCLNQLACPKCGSKRTQRRGCVATRAASFYRFQCLHCGGWFRSSKKVHTFKGEQGVNI